MRRLVQPVDRRRPRSSRVQVGVKTASADFPKPSGKSLAELRQGMPEGLILAPSVSVLEPGTNRYGFALFDAARKQVAEAPVALYVSRTDGTGVRGPYVARSESLAVKPQFESRTTASDPNAAKSVYVAQVPFAKPGRYRVTAITKLDGRPVSSSSFSADVQPRGTRGLPPSVGDAAPKVDDADDGRRRRRRGADLHADARRRPTCCRRTSPTSTARSRSRCCSRRRRCARAACAGRSST